MSREVTSFVTSLFRSCNYDPIGQRTDGGRENVLMRKRIIQHFSMRYLLNTYVLSSLFFQHLFFLKYIPILRITYLYKGILFESNKYWYHHQPIHIHTSPLFDESPPYLQVHTFCEHLPSALHVNKDLSVSVIS